MSRIAILALVTLLLGSNPAVASQKADLFCLSHVVYHEARGESFNGQLAVAYVVLNRSLAWHRSICQVVYQPAQFTNIRKTIPVETSREWQTAHFAATMATKKYIDDPTKGSLYFYAPHKVSEPRWARMKKFVGRIGHHLFYK